MNHRLASVYARLFSELIGQPELAARYETIRRPRLCQQNPAKVFVLSRVTLGADVAVTSVMLDAAKNRFPQAEIYYVGARKGWELFAADPRIHHRDASYGRSALLADRLAAKPADLDEHESIVIDPDSRLTQLGLLPVCQDANYYFFDSRAYGGTASQSLTELAVAWCAQTFETPAKAFIAPLPSGLEPAAITVSLGVGENPSKRLPDPFEHQLLARLPAQTLIDEGGSPEEAQRVLASLKPGQRTFNGAFARFAAAIRESNFYVGYDSAGGHVASVCGVPQVSIFAGAANPRMAQRWKTRGTVLNADELTPAQILDRVDATLQATLR